MTAGVGEQVQVGLPDLLGMRGPEKINQEYYSLGNCDVQSVMNYSVYFNLNQYE